MWTISNDPYAQRGQGSGIRSSCRPADHQSPSSIGTERASIDPALTLCTKSQVKRPSWGPVVGATYASPIAIDAVSSTIHPWTNALI